MVPICSQNPKSESGYRAHTRLYQASGCTECPLRKECHNAEGNRIIRVNHRLNEYKEKGPRTADFRTGDTPSLTKTHRARSRVRAD
ncbi:MAG: transposase [Alistipes indistinctus]